MSQGPVTYILPDVTWAILLGPILQDAPEGAIIEVHTLSMQAVCEERLAENGRSDLVVRLVDQPSVKLT